jgi:hypothetical protein
VLFVAPGSDCGALLLLHATAPSSSPAAPTAHIAALHRPA